MLDDGIPMPASSASMPMPSYGTVVGAPSVDGVRAVAGFPAVFDIHAVVAFIRGVSAVVDISAVSSSIVVVSSIVGISAVV